MHTGVEEFIQKADRAAGWYATPNGLSQSQVGLRIDQPVAYGWSFVGAVALGFDPYSLQLANGVYAMAPYAIIACTIGGLFAAAVLVYAIQSPA